MSGSWSSRRIFIAGASSLLGAELKAVLEESRFADSDFRLVDEESVAGILTEAGGQPAVIQPVEEDTFNKATVIFFTGSPAFTARNLPLAQGSGAKVVDLSGELSGNPSAQSWFPNLDKLSGRPLSLERSLFSIPSAPAEMIARFALALRSLKPAFLSAVALQPVSASAGKAGVEELESQTGQLLSFQPVGKQVFDAQVAFSMLDRFGPDSSVSLQAAADILRRQVRSCLPNDVGTPAVQLLHAPVYYGTTVVTCASLDPETSLAAIGQACTSAGFSLTEEDSAPSNLAAAGESTLPLSPPRFETTNPGICWLWAAADDLRLPAANAVKLAETLFE